MVDSTPSSHAGSASIQDWFNESLTSARLQEKVVKARENVKNLSAENETAKQRFPDHQGVMKHNAEQLEAARTNLSYLSKKLDTSTAKRDDYATQLFFPEALPLNKSPYTHLASTSRLNVNHFSHPSHDTDGLQKLEVLQKRVENLEQDNKKLHRMLLDVHGKVDENVHEIRNTSTNTDQKIKSSNENQSLRMKDAVGSIASGRADDSSCLADCAQLRISVEKLQNIVEQCQTEIRTLDERASTVDQKSNLIHEKLKSLSSEIAGALKSGPIDIHQFRQLESIVLRNDHSIRALDSRYNALTTDQLYQNIVALINPFGPKITRLEQEVTKFHNELRFLHSAMENLSKVPKLSPEVEKRLNEITKKTEQLRAEFSTLSPLVTATESAQRGQSELAKDMQEMNVKLSALDDIVQFQIGTSDKNKVFTEDTRNKIDTLESSVDAMKHAVQQSSVELQKFTNNPRQNSILKALEEELTTQKNSWATVAAELATGKSRIEALKNDLERREEKIQQQLHKLEVAFANGRFAGLARKQPDSQHNAQNKEQQGVPEPSTQATTKKMIEQKSEMAKDIEVSKGASSNHDSSVSASADRVQQRSPDAHDEANPSELLDSDSAKQETDSDTITVAMKGPKAPETTSLMKKKTAKNMPDYLRAWTQKPSTHSQSTGESEIIEIGSESDYERAFRSSSKMKRKASLDGRSPANPTPKRKKASRK